MTTGSGSSNRDGPVAPGVDAAVRAAPLTPSIRIVGVVSHGERRGRTIGFPTANLYFGDDTALPPDGVYAGFVRDADRELAVLGAGAVSIGTNPTFGRFRRRLEVHVLGLDDDLYDCRIEVELTARLRGMTTFASVDELVAQIEADVALTARLTAGLEPFAEERAG